MERIPVLVVAGGDVSGKSNLLKSLRNEFPEACFIPEVATAVYGDPMMPRPHPGPGSSPEVLRNWELSKQVLLAHGQIAFEALAQQEARERGCSIIISDRGLLDHWAYIPREDHSAFEHATGLTRSDANRRYSVVLYLETLAASVPELYLELQACNGSRIIRTVDEMLALERSLRSAWQDHPGFFAVEGLRPESLHLEAARRMLTDLLLRAAA